MSKIITCAECVYCHEGHYEKEGDPPYIKLQCTNKLGLKNGYRVHADDFCSRAARKVFVEFTSKEALDQYNERLLFLFVQHLNASHRKTREVFVGCGTIQIQESVANRLIPDFVSRVTLTSEPMVTMPVKREDLQ